MAISIIQSLGELFGEKNVVLKKILFSITDFLISGRSPTASTAILGILMALSLVTACATLPENVGRKETFAYPDTGDTVLGREISRQAAAHPGESGFHLLGNGLDAFVARAVLVHLAERSIDVQYYLYHNDLVGRLLTWQLLQAADRGVRVRLLVDDMDLSGRDLNAAALDSHPNVEVRIFNPFSRKTGRVSQYVTRMGSVTRRMHNKSFTVDSQATILGGRNIGNEYFEANPDLAFADLDVFAIGPVAREVSTAFDRYWNSELAYPVSVLVDEPPTPEEIGRTRQQLKEFVAAHADSVYLQALRKSDLADKIRKSQVQLLLGKRRRRVRPAGKGTSRTRRKGISTGPATETVRGGGSKRADHLFPLFRPRGSGNGLPDRARRPGRAGADPDQLAGLERREHRARRLFQIPKAAPAGRGRAVRDEQETDPGTTGGEKGGGGIVQGQPARQIVRFRPQAGLHRLHEP